MRSLLMVVLLAACGSVSTKTDAGHDGSGGHSDGPADVGGDAAGTPVTAIGAGTITQFSPGSLVNTKVLYNYDYDDLSEWSNSTSSFTPKHDGDYLICASVSMGTANLNTAIELQIFKNGVVANEIGRGHGIANGCATIRLAANDSIDIEVFLGNQNASNPVIPDANWDWLTIERVTEVTAAKTSTAFPSTSGSFVPVRYDTASVNDGTLYNTSTYQLRATTAGDFGFCASVGLSDPTLEGELDLFVNATREKTLSNGVGLASGCRSVRLAANDLVDVRFFQNTGNTTIPTDGNANDWLAITKQPITTSVSAISPFNTTSHNWAQVLYSTVAFDDASQFSPTLHQFTATTAGDYEVCASLLVPTSTVDGDEIDIYKNAAREKGLSYGHFGLSGCRVMRLSAGDYVQIWQYTLGDKAYTNDPNWDWFEVSKLR